MNFADLRSLVLEFIFPKRCIGCRRFGKYLCNDCIGSIKFIENQVCPNCRRFALYGQFCGNACSKGFSFARLLVCANYTENLLLKKLIFLCKYRFVSDALDVLVELLCLKSRDFLLIVNNSWVVPVPLFRKRRRMRGFNQSFILAEQLAREYELDFFNCLVRVAGARAQAGLVRKERLANVSGLYKVNEEFADLIVGRKILLVDDVATTGSTINECSQVLLESGASEVNALVLGRGG